MDKERLPGRNKKIRDRFKVLAEDENRSVDYALQVIYDELYGNLTKGTIWLIISQTGYYKDK